MLNKTTYQTTCDVKNCKNLATYCFDTKGRFGKTYLCRACLAQLGEDVGKLNKVKSVANAVKKAMDEATTKEI